MAPVPRLPGRSIRMEEIGAGAVRSVSEVVGEESRLQMEAASDPTPTPERAAGGKKKRKKGAWFRPTVSGLLAVVTIIGALVAWRASVASDESGDLDSTGLLATQNYE